VLVAGVSLLRDTKLPFCQPDRESQEVRCLSGAKVQDVAETVPQLIKSTNCYPLLPFHVGTNDTTSWNMDRIKEDCEVLEVQVKSIGAQIICSSTLPIGGKEAARNRHTMQINFWLHVWCHCEGFCFYDNGTFLMTIAC